MQLVLADDQYRDHLLPFTFTRPCADIRCGILTIRRKWEILLNIPSGTSGSLTQFYLSGSYPLVAGTECLVINGALLPDESILRLITALKIGQQIVWKDRLLAAVLHRDQLVGLDFVKPIDKIETVHYIGLPVLLQHPWDIFSMNDEAIRSDFQLLKKGRKSELISGTNQTFKPDDIFIEPGAKIECAMLNASTGPIYIGKDAEVMEGCMIRGPFALGEQGVLKMGAKIYGATTIGPGAKVGGEVSNSVIFGNSNKAHDGFLGNSVIGEWCNLGADSNNSNLKNNYSEVRVWDYPTGDYIATGLQFCGLFMGDHSKCSINTMFNTGTVVGVFANIFGAGFPSKFVPSFSWGADKEGEMFLIDKALELAEKVMSRRKITLTEADKNILSHLYLMQLKPTAED
ncbi:MAG: GlmU family protein [Bacteroidetes bacterium]|nr:GlmU family protein [Bacteroidota bacterium]